MIQFFQEGGFGMFPVLIFGLVMLATAARYAFDPHPSRLRTAHAIGWVLVVTTLHAMLMDVAAVFSYCSSPSLEAEARTRDLFTGLMESTRPGAMGGAMLALALVLVAVGTARAGQREIRERAAA